MNVSTARIGLGRTALVSLVSFMLLVNLGCKSQSSDTPPNGDAADARTKGQSTLDQARSLTQRGDTAGAVAAYSEILRQDPHHLSALGNRAALLAAMNRETEAMTDYNQLLLVDPNNVPALDRRASLAYAMGDFRGSLQDLLEIAAHRENDPALLNRIGEAHLQLGEYSKALRAFEETLRIGGPWPAAIRNRATTYYNLGDFVHAHEDYAYLIDQDPTDSEALNGLGLLAQFEKQDLVAAESYFRQALLSNINNAGAWYNLGFLEANAGNNPEALKDFDQAIRCDAHYADAYVNRGLVAMRTQNARAAKADFQRAMDLQPQNVHTRLLLGWAKCAVGERAAGCIDLAEAKSKAEPGAADLIAQYCR